MRTRPSSRRTRTTSSRPTRTSAPPASGARPTTVARSWRRREAERRISSRRQHLRLRRGTSVAPAPVTQPCRAGDVNDRSRLSRYVHLHREDRGRPARGVRRRDRREPRRLRRMRAVRDDRRRRHSCLLGRAERRLRAVRQGGVRQRRVPRRDGRAIPGVALGQAGDIVTLDGVLRRLGLRPPLPQRRRQAA